MNFFTQAALDHAIQTMIIMSGEREGGQLNMGSPPPEYKEPPFSDCGDVFAHEAVCDPTNSTKKYQQLPISRPINAADVWLRFDTPLAALQTNMASTADSCACFATVEALMAYASRPAALDILRVCADYRFGPSWQWVNDTDYDIARLRNYGVRDTPYAENIWAKRRLDVYCNFLLRRLQLPDFDHTLRQERRFEIGPGLADMDAICTFMRSIDRVLFCAGMIQLRAAAAGWLEPRMAATFRASGLSDLWTQCGLKITRRYLDFRYRDIYIFQAGVRHLVQYLACPEPIVYGPAMFMFNNEIEPPENFSYKMFQPYLRFTETKLKEVMYAHALCMQMAASPVIKVAADKLQQTVPAVGIVNTPIIMGALLWRWFYLHEIVPLFSTGVNKRNHILQIQTLSDAASITPDDVTLEHVIESYTHLVAFSQVEEDVDKNTLIVSPRWRWMHTSCRRLPPVPASICANDALVLPPPPPITQIKGRARKPIDHEAMARSPVMQDWLLNRQLQTLTLVEQWPRVHSLRRRVWGEYDRDGAYVSREPAVGQWLLNTHMFMQSVPNYRATRRLMPPIVVEWAHPVPLPKSTAPRFQPIDYRRRIREPHCWAENERTAGRIVVELVTHCKAVDGPEAHTCISITQFVALYVYWTRHCQLDAPPIVMNVGAWRRLCTLVVKALVARLMPADAASDNADEQAAHAGVAGARVWSPLPTSIFCTLADLAGRDFNAVAFLQALGAGGGEHDEFTNFLWDNECRGTAQDLGPFTQFYR